MSIQQHEYEISVWKETLAQEGGRVIEKKMAIIGANDMDYIGRARKPKFITKINGTHSLTFEMSDRYFDSKEGNYIHNELIDAIFPECKIKFKYKDKWYEFKVKNVADSKQYKSYMKTFTCSDSFIDELARNGYGITFDEELYNNVEEIGTFSEEILEDSVWEYDASSNWGDFTEYTEEKLFKIPLSLFNNSLTAHKVNFNAESETQIINAFTQQARALEIGDDLAREEGHFWDQYGEPHKNPLLLENTTITNENGAYIYVPYSQLGFCYVSSDEGQTNGLQESFVATEYPAMYQDKSYAIAPQSIDPNKLIQFIFVPNGEKVQVDESGLIVNKNFTYVITIKEWNEQLNSTLFYKFEDYKENGYKKKVLTDSWTDKDYIYGNKAAYYEGYLEEIPYEYNTVNQQPLSLKGKKISIADRTEINISEEIDQFITVYNNNANEYSDLYTNEKWTYNPTVDNIYRVCSTSKTREIVPQLARNLLQNSVKINSTTGWEIMSLEPTAVKSINAQVQFSCIEGTNTIKIPTENYSIDVGYVQESYLVFSPAMEEIVNQSNLETNYYLDIVSDINQNNILYPVAPLYQDSNNKLFYTYAINTYSADWRNLSPTDQSRLIASRDNINSLAEQRWKEYIAGFRFVSQSSDTISEHNGLVNFGIVGQEKIIEKDKVYVLGINIRELTNYTRQKIGFKSSYQTGKLSDTFIRIGKGKMIKDNDYIFDEYIDIPISVFYNNNMYNGYILFSSNQTFENPYLAIYSNAAYELVSCELFEAYTKGIDQFDNGYFKYSGRDLFSSYVPRVGQGYKYSQLYKKDNLLTYVIFEDDVMPGDIYEYKQYFIQKLQLKENGNCYDTFTAKKYLDENAEYNSSTLPLCSSQYTEDDYDIITNYINLSNCGFYNPEASATDYDCKCNSTTYNKVCLYQKYGYCPYRFQTEKHCRKIRTLKGEKSNRFNLTQELGKVFKVYPIYWISHDDNGKVLTQQQAVQQGLRKTITTNRENWMDKRVFYITEKGNENKLGFRYGKNLTNISRTINSDKIVSKLYVLDVDSDISATGLSTIKTAEDNPSKDNFIIDFSYYIAQGLLDKEIVDADLYGIDDSHMGYLKTLGYFNNEYDKLSNRIINLSAASFTELEANLNVNLTGIETAQKRMRQLEKIMSSYTAKNTSDYTKSSAFKSYQYEYIEQNAIYVQLIEDTFYTNGISIKGTSTQCPPAKFLDDMSIEDVKEQWVDTHNYTYGILGQYNKEYLQISEWQKEQSGYLKRINQLSLDFYRKYEPYLKEGTWSDTNYVSDNAYYHSAVEVAKEGAIPKVSYNIMVSDIEPLYKQGDYLFDIADTSYVEDIGMFGVNAETGLPNRLKVLVSSLSEEPDEPQNNSIGVQNFTTQFEDLFQQVSSTVQTLTFNENIYHRSSNFTALQNIEKDSLQGTLDGNDLTLIKTAEKNIELDDTGQSGSDINNHTSKYKLNGQGLFFSNDGGQTWNVGVGPNGINADYIKGGTIDTSKIRIVDGQYMYFSWDKDGINAYKDPKNINSENAFKDYARFNKYGLSLVEEGKIKLRAGYAYSGDDGTMDSEDDVSDETPIGFYLYNSAGKPIFATESSRSTNAAQETARINLIGEMLITNNTEVSSYVGYKYGGTKYTIGTRSCYNLVNLNNIITSISGTINETVLTYVRAEDFILSIEECAAALAYYYRNIELTKIIIEEENTGITYEYNNPTIELSMPSLMGKFVDNTELRYCNFDYYGAEFSNSDTIQFVIIEGEVFKPLNELGTATTKTTLTMDSGTAISPRQVMASNATGIYLSQPYESQYTYYKEKTFTNCYQIDTAYYTTLLGDEIATGDGVVSLYLNNRTDLQSASSNNSRLFVCCNSNSTTGTVNNIFSVLKDGSLHMGGTITGATSSNNLPDQISFNSDEVLIIKDGKLSLSFDDIVDKNSGLSLVNYVSTQLSSHNHYIDQIEVDWPRFTQGVIDGTLVNFGDLWVSVRINGSDVYLSFYDLLRMAGFYDPLYWGNAYTNLAN